MKQHVFGSALGLLCCAAVLCVPAAWAPAWAKDSGERPALSLVPPPKEVQLRDGGFRFGPKTKILVQFGHQSEDRIAAETLAEEVADQAGLQLTIVGEKQGRRADEHSIVLARLDDGRVRKFLARNGLHADGLVGDEGYILFSDKSHLIVAANSGEGLFYGVQTLRQLLRRTNNVLVCPAIGIRDWPNLKSGAGQDFSRESLPESLKNIHPQHE
jgi:hexosaminidase